MRKIVKYFSIVSMPIIVVLSSCCKFGSCDPPECMEDYYLEAPPKIFKERMEAVKSAGYSSTIIDYRDSVSYALGHIEGAINHEVVIKKGKSDVSAFYKWISENYPTSTYIFLYGANASVDDNVAEDFSKLVSRMIITYSLRGGFEGWVADSLPVVK